MVKSFCPIFPFILWFHLMCITRVFFFLIFKMAQIFLKQCAILFTLITTIMYIVFGFNCVNIE